MTNEAYRTTYKHLTNQIESLTRDRQQLDMDYASSESDKHNLHVGDIFNYRGKEVYISSIFTKYGKVLASLYLIKKNGEPGLAPYNSYGTDLTTITTHIKDN